MPLGWITPLIAFQNAAPNRVCGFAANGPANGPEGPKNVSKRTGGVCARSLRLRPSGGERSRSVGQHGVHHGRLRCEQRWTSAASAGSGSAQPCCLYVALLGLCVVFLCLYFVLSRLSRIGSGCRKHVVCILSSCVLLVRAACSCACVCVRVSKRCVLNACCVSVAPAYARARAPCSAAKVGSDVTGRGRAGSLSMHGTMKLAFSLVQPSLQASSMYLEARACVAGAHLGLQSQALQEWGPRLDSSCLSMR